MHPAAQSTGRGRAIGICVFKGGSAIQPRGVSSSVLLEPDVIFRESTFVLLLGARHILNDCGVRAVEILPSFSRQDPDTGQREAVPRLGLPGAGKSVCCLLASLGL